MANILQPGSSDQDFVEMLTHNVPVEMTKTQGTAGSAVPVGSVKKGYLTAPLAPGRTAAFREADQGNTTEVQKVVVDDTGRIVFETTTSLYTLLSHASEYRKKSLLYLRRGYLDFDEMMPDGFYDGGRSMEFEEKSDGTLVPIVSSHREIIILDINKDEALKRKLAMATEMLERITDPTQRVLLLAQFVSNVLGGIQVVSESKAVDDSDREINDWKAKYGNGLYLGYLNHGVCRHRAMLFKYLADRLGIRSRVVRGDSSGAHIWNIVDIGGKHFVIDVMKNPFKLFSPDDPAVNHYRRKNGSGRTSGTISGKSIPIV